MIQVMSHFQALQLEHGEDRHEDMIILRRHRLRRRLRQSGIGFERFMKHFHVPPFLIDRSDVLAIEGQIAACQMQDAGAAVLVRKNLPYQKDFFAIALQPAVHRLLLRQ